MIYKMMELSTAHVTKETAEKMSNDAVNMYANTSGVALYGKSGYGYFVSVPEDLKYNDDTIFSEIPSDLLECLKYAFSHDCEWIMFDCDAAKISELPTYEW